RAVPGRSEPWGVSRSDSAVPGRSERWGVWGAISGPPISSGPARGVRAQERARPTSRLGGRVLAHHALPRLQGARVVAQAGVREADSQERVGGLGRGRRHLDHPLELEERLAIVALKVIRLTDPVLG